MVNVMFALVAGILLAAACESKRARAGEEPAIIDTELKVIVFATAELHLSLRVLKNVTED
jgi:hypothetical protein